MKLTTALQALYRYNEWANDHVLAAAIRLTPSELATERGASFGSIEANLAHILAGQVVWLQRWTSVRDPRPLAELQSVRGLRAIATAFDESHRELTRFVGKLDDTELQRVQEYEDSRGTSQSRPLWQLFLHVVNHVPTIERKPLWSWLTLESRCASWTTTSSS